MHIMSLVKVWLCFLVLVLLGTHALAQLIVGKKTQKHYECPPQDCWQVEMRSSMKPVQTLSHCKSLA